MIEIIPDEQVKPDITDELVQAAIGILRDYATGRNCSDCCLHNLCEIRFESCPQEWTIR